MSGQRGLAWGIAAAVVMGVATQNASAYLLSGVGGAPTDPIFVGPATIDFDSGPVGLFTSQTFLNVKFTGMDGPLDVSPNYMGQYNTMGVNSLQSGQVTNPILPHQIKMTFTIPVSAFTFNWGAADNTWELDAYDSSNNLLESHLIALLNANVNNGEYFGIANATAIKTAVLLDQLDNFNYGDHIFIDDFTYSFENAPEPGVGPVLVTIALVGHFRGRRRHPDVRGARAV